METSEILDRLVELAREAGIDVRVLSRGGSDTSPESAVCRVRGEVWVVLAEADLPAQRVAVLVRALREHAGPELQDRYLPPALRSLLDAG